MDYLENFNVDDRDMNKFIIGTISNIDRPMNPAAKGSRSMNLYMNHVTEEMIREEREQILTAGQSDIRALSKSAQGNAGRGTDLRHRKRRKNRRMQRNVWGSEDIKLIV